MPPHVMYIEAFAGSAAVLRYKRPALANIAIERDAAVAEELRCSLANFSEVSPGICPGRHAISGDTAGDTAGVTVICGEAISWLTEQQSHHAIPDDALIYADPPYLMDTRRGSRPIYSREMMTPVQHRQLLRCLRSLKCRVILSGYWSELYATELHDWRTLSFQSMTHAGPATEWLWLNFPQPFELHDYRFLGDNFRERERIKRQQARWTQRLAKMDAAQRYAMLNAIEQSRSGR
jgi:hypothetical protein